MLRRILAVLVAVLLATPFVLAAPPVMPTEGATRAPERRGPAGRVPFAADSIALQMARGELGVPKAGEAGWDRIERADDGTYPIRPGHYAAFVVSAEAPTTMLLNASGHGMVYVNGEPRPGDSYGYGYLQLPVRLNAGENLLLFQAGRGPIRAELIAPRADVFIQEADVSTPDFLAGRDETLPLGAAVVNATEEPISAIPWSGAGGDGEHARIEGAPMTVPAMSVRKVVFPIHYDGRAGERFTAALGFGDHATARRDVDLAIRRPGGMYRRTFISRIDGSAQYYAVQPRIPGGGDAGDDRPALVLSLHGASVEATSQAAAYAPKSWCDIVCPTNRRPFGFDWEDWGRIDAMEVLDDAMRHLNSDPSRVHLTGHSMGGHGTWSIATLYPDRFAAIGPSAGWLSFGSYTGAGHPELLAETDGVAGIFARAARISDTEQRLSNLQGKPIYILHGDADDNVPVREARDIGAKLTALDIAYESHEQPGAGHWWDGDAGPGADCVDWPAMFAFFEAQGLPAPLASNPASQPNREAGAHREGFKAAFDNRVVLVYGTKGTPEETAWARAKARYDAESFYYRGNGSFEVVADADFDPAADSGRNIVLYGNADTHEDWSAVLGDCPIDLRRGEVKVGDVFSHKGEDRGIVFRYPRMRGGNEREGAFVGVVGGSGLIGMKLTDRLPYFTSGVHYPDWTIFGPAVFERGYGAADAAGYFDNAWNLDSTNSARSGTSPE